MGTGRVKGAGQAALMSLEVGSRVGHYVVVAPLGAGRTGEVYRTRDSQLNPDVAIEVIDGFRIGRIDYSLAGAATHRRA